MPILGRVVHQIRQRRIDGEGLRAPLRGERGLEHEDVLLPAGWLQFRPVVDSVKQHVFRPSDLAGGPRGVPKPSWLIRVVLQDEGFAPRTSHETAFFKKLQTYKFAFGEGGRKGTLHPASQMSAPSDRDFLRADIAETSIVVL